MYNEMGKIKQCPFCGVENNITVVSTILTKYKVEEEGYCKSCKKIFKVIYSIVLDHIEEIKE